jgi:hypothetical protein
LTKSLFFYIMFFYRTDFRVEDLKKSRLISLKVPL